LAAEYTPAPPAPLPPPAPPAPRGLDSVAGLWRWLTLFAAAPGATAAPTAANRASLAVDGAVTFEVAIVAADLTIERGAAKAIEVEVIGNTNRVSLAQRGSRVTASFDNGPLRNGELRVRLPSGTGVVAQTVSGDITVTGVGGAAALRAVSGDIAVAGAADVSVEVVSGSVRLTKITGEIRLETVSGPAEVESLSSDRTRLTFETTSGEIGWVGTCGEGCRIKGESLSGQVSLRFAKTSSFELDFETFSGSLNDQLGLEDLARSGERGRGEEHRGRYAKGAGAVDIETFSAQLSIDDKD
jgi:hypothetical protein